MNRVNTKTLVALLLAGCAIGVVLIVTYPPSREWFNQSLLEFFETVQRMEGWGPPIIGAAFIPACLLFVPGSPLTLFGGFAFGGTLMGLARVTAAVSIGSTVGACLAFLAGRYLARGWIERRIAGHPRFHAIDAAIAKKGFKIVLLLRLSPAFPFNLLNYACGLTSVTFRDYALASWIGMLPGTIMYVYLGSTARNFADILAGRVQQSPVQQLLFYVGMLATIAAAVIITRAARRALNAALPAVEDGPQHVNDLPNNVCPIDRGGVHGAGTNRRADASPLAGVVGRNMTEGVRVLPDDEFNRTLVANVHPPGWVNPTPTGRYNLVVVGGGPAGLIAAIGAAGLGARVALVERELMGGDCLNVGCVPSKALLRAARAAAAVRDAENYGVHVPPGTRVDFAAVMERMRRLRSSISHVDSAARYRDLGVDVFLGEGRFTAPDAVQVGDATLRFRKAVIATGARAVPPEVPGLAEVGFHTNETVFSLTELPSRLAVIGAGPIGCELAQAFARCGAQVTLLESGSQVLPKDDRDAALCVESALRRDGVTLSPGCRIQRVERRAAEKWLQLESDGQSHELTVDAILVGAGRAPNVESLNLEAAAVEYDTRRGVLVDDRLRTSNPQIFAAGDVCSQFRFTHAAEAMARIVIQNALFLGRARASALVIPWCTYTDPEVAHVGLNDKTAAEAGIAIDTFTQDLSHVDRAILDSETAGFVKIHVRTGTDKIVGATIVAAHAGEMISQLTLAMTAGAGLGTLARTIHPYPTQGEAIKRAADAFNRTRLTPFVRGLLQQWLAWGRGG